MIRSSILFVETQRFDSIRTHISTEDQNQIMKEIIKLTFIE